MNRGVLGPPLRSPVSAQRTERAGESSRRELRRWDSEVRMESMRAWRRVLGAEGICGMLSERGTWVWVWVSWWSCRSCKMGCKVGVGWWWSSEAGVAGVVSGGDGRCSR